MKTAKKLLCVLLALAMVLSLGIATAFAEGNTTPGKITIQNATKDKTYAAYKLLDATVGDDGEVAYTIDSTSPWYSVVNGSGLFTLNKVSGLSTTEKTVYNVIRKDSATEDAILNLFKGHFSYNAETAVWTCDVSGAPVAASVTAAGSSVELSVPYGYYLITSTLGAHVTVDTNHPTVIVTDKNQGPSWDNEPGTPEDPNPGKVIVNADGSKTTINSANYGDSVTFDIGLHATNFVGENQVTYYYVKDTIANSFAYDMSGEPAAFHPVVKVGDENLTEGTDYTVTVNGNSFEIAIKWANITTTGTGTDEKIDTITSIYAANADIHVQYSATVNADGENVIIGGNGNKNTANFTYKTNKPGDSPDNPKTPYENQNEKTTTTYVYALAFQKVDEKYQRLAGAEFSTAPLYVVQESEGVYNLCKAGTKGATQTVVTADGGMILIKGVAAGTYTFSETKAPEGYNLLTAPFTVEAQLIESYTNYVITTYYFDEDGKLVDTVEKADPTKTITYYCIGLTADPYPVFGVGIVNSSGTELPSTGGIGTTIFYIIGSTLMVGAAVVLVARKKMSAGE